MLSVHAALVATRTCPTESASFTASGSLRGLGLILVERFLLRGVVRVRLVGRLRDDEGVARPVDRGGFVAGRNAGGIGRRIDRRSYDDGGPAQ